jgi:hypothetical protein
MKNLTITTLDGIWRNRKSACPLLRTLSVCIIALATLAWHANVLAQVFTDNFDSYSGTITPSPGPSAGPGGWTVISAGGSTITFPAVGNGKGIRMQNAPGSLTSFLRTDVYSDFYVAADIIDWTPDIDQALVLSARATDYLGIAATKEYVMNWDVRQDGDNTGDRFGGQLQINRIDSVSPLAAFTIGAAEISLERGRSYRFVFKGVGADLTAQIYDSHDLTTPLITLVANDGTYPNGACGITVFDRGGRNSPDGTFDNFYLGPSDPNTIAPAILHSTAGTPQVVTRTPAKRFANFHPVASGISFTANTYSTNVIDAAATKLYLNGLDVSASLAPLPASGTNVTFNTAADTLASNTVYSARIELQDTTGTLKSTNTFWFDTFTDAYLLSGGGVKTIESEDYNYQGGQFQLDPIPVSGYDTNGAVVNGSGVGYLDLVGIPDTDYHAADGGPDGNFSDYRLGERVRTELGMKEDIQDGAHPAGDLTTRPFDTQRSQYAATNMQEYLVCRTRAGDWRNFTRVFDNTNYNVYLRCGSFGTVSIQLDLVGGDPTTTNQTTTPLGTFAISTHLWRANMRYVPLLVNGTPASIRLGGTNTVRLTMLGTDPFQNRLVEENYLLFVPTSQGPTIFDNFNDGNDSANPPWDRYDPLGNPPVGFPPASFLFTNGGYRIYAPTPPVPDAGPARAGSFLRNADYGDFYVSVDVIDFDDTVRQAFGIAARVSTPGLQSTDGYLFSWEPGGGTLPGTNNGDLDISRLVDEAPVGQIETAASGLHLERGKSYRFVFMGKGFDFEGQVYELPNLSTPLIRLPAHDPDGLYPSGRVGLITADQGSGALNQGDATFDNFLATTAEPRLTPELSGNVLRLTWPQIPFRLQSSPSLSAPVWTDVTTGISQVGDQNAYSTTVTGAEQYYRLVFP